MQDFFRSAFVFYSRAKTEFLSDILTDARHFFGRQTDRPLVYRIRNKNNDTEIKRENKETKIFLSVWGEEVISRGVLILPCLVGEGVPDLPSVVSLITVEIS